MAPARPSLELSTDLSPAALQPVVRHVLHVAVLLGLLGVVVVLPGAGRPVPGTPVTVGGLASTIVVVGVVAAILSATGAVEDLVRSQLSGPTGVVEDFVEAAGYAVWLVAILVAHRGLSGMAGLLVRPEAAWMYDVAFLGFALVPLTAIVRRLARNADAVAARLAWALAGVERADEDVGTLESETQEWAK